MKMCVKGFPMRAEHRNLVKKVVKIRVLGSRVIRRCNFKREVAAARGMWAKSYSKRATRAIPLEKNFMTKLYARSIFTVAVVLIPFTSAFALGPGTPAPVPPPPMAALSFGPGTPAPVPPPPMAELSFGPGTPAPVPPPPMAELSFGPGTPAPVPPPPMV
jgi:hypothetical protein